MVFDVDGVLVDTDASYIEAVVRTAHWLLGPHAEGIDARMAKLFKRTGDWNNDWDLSYALYCWRLGAPALDASAAARSSLRELRERAGARAELTYVEVLGVFEEFYNGSAVATERYGMPARVGVARGLAENETIALRAALVDELRAIGVSKFGVVTGRVRADWEQVRARIPLPAGVAVATDEDGRKPDAAPLRKVVESLEAGEFVSVGDTLNDLRMVQAYGRGHAVMLCAADEEDEYRAAGARLFIRSLDDLPAVIGSLR